MTRNGSLILLYIMIAGVTAVTERPSYSSSTETTDESMEENEDKLARLTKINNDMQNKIGPFYDNDGKYDEALKEKMQDIYSRFPFWINGTLQGFPEKSLHKKEKLIEKTKKKTRKFARKVNALKKEKVHKSDDEFKGMVDFLETNIVDFRTILKDLNFS